MASFYAGNIVGHTLGNRYRLLSLLGMGSSARVYLAEDVKLRRRVAVKLLHASLAGDETFLRRFQREAESLAPLTHPNIVIIHDVNDRQNENGEPPYLVTEYLSGGSLRNLLDGGAHLTPAQAALVGLGAARGLTFAHAHGVVHRDIKPANLLFGDDQRVRIGDFGLARALADYGRTEPAGALVGTAKYLSPEQALGTATLDGRSDVYSLALVLYEAMTGEVPFTTDTWQGTAMARLQNNLVVRRDLGPLGPVLEAAGTVDPANRLDAAGFAVALESAAKALPRPDALLLDGSRVFARAAQLDERDPTLFAAGTTRSAVGVPDINLAQVGDVKRPETDSAATRKSKSKTARSEPSPVETSRRTRRKSTARIVLSGVLGAVIVGGGVVGYTVSQRIPTHVVPNLVGMAADKVSEEVADEKFLIIRSESQFSDSVPSGSVIRQDPAAGVTLKENQPIAIVVSNGVKLLAVPDLDGKTLEAATAALEAVGLRSSNPPNFVSNETVQAGRVVGWTPRGDVAPSSLIALTISSGPKEVELPKLRGLTPEAASALLPVGVTTEIVTIYSDVKKGLVSSSDPKSGTLIQAGATVKIFVSKGPEPTPSTVASELVSVPSVINLSVADATAKLNAAGFAAGKIVGPADQPVLHTRPLRNTKAKRGSRVTLYTTEENVPEVPGVAATKRTSTTGVARPLPVETTPAPAEPTAAQ
jgi:eukaryotic-like serine/threonine-protein kinase